MSHDLVAVLAHRRPDFLHATLTRLGMADRDYLRYRIYIDRGYDHAVLEVAGQFADALGDRCEVILRPDHNHWGSSYNTFEAYREAAEGDWELLHLIEEDILISEDYFDYHRQAHALAPDAFSVTGCRDRLGPPAPETSDDAIYLREAYQVSGASYRRTMLPSILKYITPAYYSNPAEHIAATFPNASLPPGQWTEQDGFLMRVREELGLWCVYPCAPRSYHAGFSGYNRSGQALSGTIEENAHRILTMSTEEMNSLSGGFNDLEAVDLDRVKPGISRITTWKENTA